jgi:hypothetical protein
MLPVKRFFVWYVFKRCTKISVREYNSSIGSVTRSYFVRLFQLSAIFDAVGILHLAC